MRPSVFLGPSLAIEEARSILDADYLPPIRRGSIPSLPDDVRLVGIIDGVLMSESAVGHREILGLINEGVTVIGGGSMGALRASELSSFGMIGVGRIFEEYSSGRIDGDDEVVLMYDPETQSPLSEPLINLRFNLEEASRRVIITEKEADDLVLRLKKLYFPLRNYQKLIEEAEDVVASGHIDGLRKFIDSDKIDYKKEDAISVLRAVKAKADFFQNICSAKKIE